MKKKTLLIALAAFLLVCVAVVVVYFALLPKTNDGSKQVTIEVVYPDASKKEFKVKTDGKFLSDALVKAGIVDEKEVSFFSTVDGVYADWNKDKAFWSITKDGEMCMLGATQLALANGDHYEITYTVSN